MQLNFEDGYNVQARTQDTVTDIALDLIQNDKQVIIFVNSKRSAEACAERIADAIPNHIPLPKRHGIHDTVLNALSSPTDQCEKLAKTVLQSTAFHHSGLDGKQRQAIEDGFRARKIKCICATPTLAAGLDMPAFAVILRDLKRYSGGWGMTPIPVLEYEQMTGRAGRPGYDDIGLAITIAKNEDEHTEIQKNYVEADAEEIHSKLAAEPTLRMHVLSLIASKIVTEEDAVYEFIQDTFYGHQYGSDSEIRSILGRVLQNLKKWDMLQSESKSASDGFQTAADLLEGNKVHATVLGKRTSQLYIDPLTAHTLLSTVKKEGVRTFPLLHVLSKTREIYPLSRVRKSDAKRVEQAVAVEDFYGDIPEPFEEGYDEFLNEVKTALILKGWISERSEKALYDAYGATPGEIHGKVSRAEWLLHSLSELLKVEKQDRKAVEKLHLRMQHGVKEEVLPLLRLKNVGRVRARKLWSHSIKDIQDIKNTTYERLTSILGPTIAKSVHEQVGKEVTQELDEKTGTLLDFT